MRTKVEREFRNIFGRQGEIRTFFAPGRVNLIGEHTDYNGGHVLPCALSMGMCMSARKRKDRTLRMYSVNLAFAGVIRADLDHFSYVKSQSWANYVLGVVQAFQKAGYYPDTGLDIVIYGNIPGGSGLSSSAALEVVTGIMLKEMFGFPVSRVDIALYGQQAENEFCGLNCGIMDQYASANGRRNQAMFLDTNTLKCEYVPIELEHEKIVLINSNVKHSLVNSEYNIRRKQCEEALKRLQKVKDIKTLGDLTCAEFDEIRSTIGDDVLERRARHAVYENQRTILAVRALKSGMLDLFGHLMNDSHVSLRDDFEVSCKEMDILAAEALEQQGVIGSRMTGGGFGGCTVSIVEKDYVESFAEHVCSIYEKRTGIKPSYYTADIGDGAREV